MRKRLVSLLLVLCMVLTLVPTTAFAVEEKVQTPSATNPFTDVKEGDWCYDAVQYARMNGFFNGTSTTKFTPNGTMTRAMFVTVLGRMAGVDTELYEDEKPFSDVPSRMYYAPYVAWAYKHGITGGTGDGKFSPDGLINRQQMATFFVRYFEAFDVDYETGANITTVPADMDSVAPYAKDAVLKLWAQGLLNGDGTNFNPGGNATRAQAATLTMRTDKAVDTWYKEPGVASDRVKIDPATGEAVTPATPETPATPAKPSKPSGGSSSGGSSGGSGSLPTTTYYEVTFALGSGQDATGVTLPGTNGKATYPKDTKITLLPTPFKSNGLFLGWYTDAAMENPVADDAVLTENLTLYAKMGEVTAVSEQETPNYITVVVPAGQVASYSFNINGYTADSVEYFTHISNQNAELTKFVAEDEGDEPEENEYVVNGTKVTASFKQGQTYSIKLVDDSAAVFFVNGVEQPSTIRVLNIITEKGEVQNLTLDGDVKYLPISSVSNMKGTALDGLYNVAISSQTGESSINQNKNVGTFTYTGNGIAVGDTVAIYEGTRPDLRDAKSQNEAVAYVEITAINGTTYSYKTADAEEILFTPDVLPVTNQVTTSAVMTLDGETETYNVTVYQEDMQFTDDIYAQMGLDSQTTVDVGDFMAFYSGDLGASATSNGYGLITEITEGVYGGKETYNITYVIVDIDDVMSSMDIYSTRNEDIELTQQQIAQIEADMVEQAISSGFVEEAAEYLTALAIETDGFRELSDDLDMDLSSYSITFADGTPVDSDTMDLMAVKAEITDKDVSAKVLLGDLVHFEDCKGVRVELVMTFKVEIGSGENKVEIVLEAIFEQEVLLNVNVSGGAVWKWAWIIPYIADYELNANFDVGTFTGIGITATAKTAGPEEEEEGFDWNMSTGNSAGDKIISIGSQIKELMDKKNEFMDKLTIPTIGMEAGGDGIDKEAESSGSITSGGLAEKYSAFMENAEESWIEILRVNIFESEGNVDPFHILVYGIGADFVVSANLYVTIGMTFEYGVAKRYNFSLSLYNKEATNEVIDLEEAHYQFDFYVMGTMGIRAGVEFEVAVGLFSLKLDSVGICAEAGAYAQMWGYFYYSLSWTKSEGKSSQCSGAMAIEIGAYLSISFKAQLFSSDKLTYQPTIYENEWPFLTIGSIENVYDFSYAEDDELLNMDVQAITEFTLSPDLFNMNYMDMKSGDIYGSDSDDEDEDGEPDNPAICYDDDTESRFSIELSNPKFNYTPATNTITVTPGTSVEETCEITIRWKHGTLAFSSQPIERTLTIEWSDPDSARYIAFDSRGGSAVKMITSAAGAAITKIPADPTRIGYDFGGWYETPACIAEFSFPSKMPDYSELTGGWTKGITVYAMWIPKTGTKYTVEHYLQELNGKYTLVDTDNMVGTTEAKTAAAAKNYTGFTVKSFVQPSIAGNGSTVVKLYYQRNSYDVNFTYGALANSNTPITYTAKYGTTIYAPTIALGGYEFAGFSNLTTDENGGIVVTGNATYAAQWNPSTDTPYRVEHYIQRANSNGYLIAGEGAVQSMTGATDSVIDLSAFAQLADTGLTYVKATANGADVTGSAPATIAADGSTVVKMYYNRKSFDLILMNGDEQISSTSTVYGTMLQAPSVPENSGYSFGGWYTDAACSEGNEFTFGTATMPAKNLTLYIKWNARGDIPYKVEHWQQDVTGDGYTKVESATENLTGSTGAETAATAKVYEGFVAKTVEQQTINADGSTVVRINYDRKTYNVNFNSNEGSSVESMTGIRHGATITAPEAPTKTGYNFAGWYKNQSLSTAWNFATDTVTAATTLYAKWEGKDGTAYTVEYYQMNVDGNGYTKVETENKSGKTGTQTTVQAKEYEGFTAQTITQQTIKGDGTTVVEVKYERNQYTLTFDADGGNGGTSTSVYYGAAITAPTNVTKTGYSFAGWGDVAATMPAANTTYTAQWTANTYSVVFDKNAPDGVSIDGTMDSQSFAYGTAQNLTANAFILPANSGYTFLGWAKNAGANVADYADGAAVKNLTADNNGTVTLYAVWKQGNAVTYTVNHYQMNVDGNGYTLVDTQTPSGIVGTLTAATANTYEGFAAQSFDNAAITATGAEVNIYYTRKQYTLTFDANGGTGGSSGSVYYGASISAPAAPSKTGYAFAGWGTVAGTMPANDTIYTAQWTANTYSVVFDKNAPSDVSVNGTMPAQSFTYGTEQALSTNVYTPAENSGYVFMGWATSANGEVVYNNSQSVSNLTAEKNGSVTLYAVWKLGETVNYTVEHYQQNVDGSGYTKVGADTQTLSGITSTLTNATANSYDGFTVQGITQKAIAGDGTTVVEVKYERNKYTLTFDADGGNGGTSASVYYGASISAPADPTKTGYTFAGWGTVAGTMPASNTTYTASWTANTYTVSFNNNSYRLPEGVTVSGTMTDQTFTYGTAQVLNANAYTLSANSGYSFLGWSRSASASAAEFSNGESVSNLTDAANGVVTLYAIWQQGNAVTYTVNHHQQNVDGNGYTKVDTDTPSGIVGALTNAEANSYEGFTAQSFSNVAISASGAVVDIYYTRNQYTLTFDANGGNGGASTPVYYGASISAPAAPTKDGYTFAGWGTVAGTMPASNTTYTASWTANTYSVIFEANAPTGITINGTMPNQTFTYDASQALNANVYAAAPNSGYVFMGWADSANGEVAYNDGQSVSNLTAAANGTVTLYAVWKLGETVNYTVEHYQQNVTGSGYTKVEADTQTLSGITGQLTNAIANTYEGFEAQGIAQQTIKGDGTTVVEVKYERNKYTLTFDADGGTGGMSGSVYYGASISAPANPTKTGYAFAGWGTVAATMPAENVTYTAQWTANKYSVVFDKNTPNGVSISGTMDSQTFTYDVEQALRTNSYAPADYSGYTFLGWAKSAGANTAEFADGASVKNLTAAENGTVTLYAVWKQGDAVTYTVKHYKMDLNGEYNDAPIVETKSGIKGTLTEAAANSYEGFTLVTTDIEQVVIGDEAIEFNIYYSRNRYTLTFKIEEGQDDVVSSVYHGATITAPIDFTHSEEKYEFTGWDAEVPATMPMKDLTFTAQWKVKVYKITFDLNGLDEVINIDTPDPIYVPHGEKYYNYMPDGVYLLQDASTQGYNGGWYPTPECVSGTMKDTTSIVTPGDHTLYRKWSKFQYTIYWRITQNGTEHYKQKGEWGTEVVVPADPTREGYTFTGWDKEIPATIPMLGVNTTSMTFVATWTANEYKLTFDANGGTCTVADKTVTFNEAYGELPVPTKTGYTFTGWYTAPTGGTKVTNSTKMTDTDNITLYAQWKIEQYTITFQNTGDSTIAPITQDYGTDITHPADPTWTGYTFEGWDKEIPETMPAEDMVITAKWKEAKYTITYELDGGNNSENNPTGYSASETPFTLATPTRKGYTFIGWTGSNGDTPEQTVTVAKGTTGNLSYTAHWQVNTYNVSFVGIVNGNYYTLAGVENLAANEAVVLPEDAILVEANKLGVSFNDWYTDKECTNEFNFETGLQSVDAPNNSTVILYSKGTGVTTEEALRSLVNAAPTNGTEFTILVGGNITLTQNIYLPAGSNIVIMSDDPGTKRTLTIKEGRKNTSIYDDPIAIFYFPNGAESGTALELQNLSLVGTAKTGTYDRNYGVYCTYNNTNAVNSLRMINCDSQKCCRAVSVDGANSNYNVYLENCNLVSYTDSAVYMTGIGILTVKDCNFNTSGMNHSAAHSGSAINIYAASEVTITDCSFTGFTATNYGGAINNNGTRTTITDCTFTNNTAKNGGAVCNSNGELTITGCTFDGNTAATNESGNAVYANGGVVRMSGCTMGANDNAVKGSGTLVVDGVEQ